VGRVPVQPQACPGFKPGVERGASPSPGESAALGAARQVAVELPGLDGGMKFGLAYTSGQGI